MVNAQGRTKVEEDIKSAKDWEDLMKQR